MVNRGEEKVWVQMNVVPRSTGNTNSGTRELTLKCKLKCYFKSGTRGVAEWVTDVLTTFCNLFGFTRVSFGQ